MNDSVLQTPLKDRLWAGAGAGVIVALVGYGLIAGLSVSPLVRVEQALATIDIAAPPPRPKPEVKVVPRVAKAAKGKPSPPNLRNKATPIVAPPPPPVMAPPPVIAAPAPNIGMAAQTGASDRAGPGQGAGGQGNGYGGGGEGGDGDGDIPPRQIRGSLKFSDLPADLRQGFSGGTVGVRYSVETDGHVGECRITRSSGKAELDQLTCQLIQQRFRFKPSRSGDDGAPVRSWIVENHSWEIDRDGDDSPR